MEGIGSIKSKASRKKRIRGLIFILASGQGVGQGDVRRKCDGVIVSGRGDGGPEFPVVAHVKVGCMGDRQRGE